MRVAWESMPVPVTWKTVEWGVECGVTLSCAVSETRLGSVRPCFRQKKVRDKG